jgi:hypothetical protein
MYKSLLKGKKSRYVFQYEKSNHSNISYKYVIYFSKDN